MTDIELFNAAREAGLSAESSALYVTHVRRREARGITPLTPEEAFERQTRAREAATKNAADAARLMKGFMIPLPVTKRDV